MHAGIRCQVHSGVRYLHFTFLKKDACESGRKSGTATDFLADPPLIFILGPLIRFLRGGRFMIWSQDVYPDVAIGVGVLREKGIPALIAGWLAGWAYSRADLIIALGDRMVKTVALVQEGAWIEEGGTLPAMAGVGIMNQP
jgi:hypothetical protein